MVAEKYNNGNRRLEKLQEKFSNKKAKDVRLSPVWGYFYLIISRDKNIHMHKHRT